MGSSPILHTKEEHRDRDALLFYVWLFLIMEEQFAVFRATGAKKLEFRQSSEEAKVCMNALIDRKPKNKLNRFFSHKQFLAFCDSYAYILLYAAVVFISSLFGQEAFLFGLTAVLVVFICLFAEDARAVVPLMLLVVYAVSWKHTPQGDSDFFNTPATFAAFGILGTVAVAALAFRLVACKQKNPNSVRYLGLHGGLAAFSAALVLNGIFSVDFVPADILFGLLIAFSFAAAYFFIRQTCIRREDNGLYLAVGCFAAAVVIFLQIFYALLFRNVWETENGVMVSGLQILSDLFRNGFAGTGLSISKDAMIAGWGMSNNFGGMLAMFLPATLYLAYKVRRGWIFYIFAFLQLGAVACTLSRTALLTGGVLLAGGAVILSVARSPRRTFVRVLNGMVLCLALAVGILFYRQIREIFAIIFERGFSDSNRFAIWEFGIEKFFSAPLFGIGFDIRFYPDFGFDIVNWVFPDMFHNVFIQILASCGLVGITAYLFHLSQVFCLLFRRLTAERILYLGLLLAVSGASLLDNHIFHIFPALIYSLALGFWEKDVCSSARMPLWMGRNDGKRLRMAGNNKIRF